MFDPQRILRNLTDRQVEFVVIGGMAMVTHGSAHVTGDLDLCYRRTEQNVKALVAALAPFQPALRGAPRELPFSFDARTIQAGLNFTLTTDVGPIDLIGEVAGIGDYDAVAAQSSLHRAFGLPVRVLSVEGLIAAKKAAGRTRDQLHLLELEELKKLRDAES